MHIKKLLFPVLFTSALALAENSVGLDINNEDFELLASANLNVLADYSSSTTYMLHAGYLNSDGDNLTSFGVSGESSLQGIEGLTLGLGTKLVFADDFVALPLMAKAAYRLPFSDVVPPTSLIASFAYAPSVLTFSDGDSYSEFRGEADMEVISKIHVFAGYRNIKTDYEDMDRTFNNSFYGGMKLSF